MGTYAIPKDGAEYEVEADSPQAAYDIIYGVQKPVTKDYGVKAEVVPQEPSIGGFVKDTLDSGGTVTPTTAKQAAKGFGEAGLTILTGIPSEVVTGLLGGAKAIHGFITGEDDPTYEAAKFIEDLRARGANVAGTNLGTRQPKTQEGQTALKMIGGAFEPISEFAEKTATDAATPGTANIPEAQKRQGIAGIEQSITPIAATALQTGIEFAPIGLGSGKKGAVSAAQRTADVKRLNALADRLNIDLGENKDVIREQIVEAAKLETPDIAFKGESFQKLQPVIMKARETSSAYVDNAYFNARAKEAGVPIKEIPEFLDQFKVASKDFGVDEDMRVVQKRLKEVDAILSLEGSPSIKLQAIHDFRKKIIKTRPSKLTDAPQAAVMDIMKAQLDDWLQTKFDTDMISGDPTAIQAWQEAIAKSADFKATFNDNKVIRDFSKQDVTAKQMKQWVLGANSVGAKGHAAKVIKRIKGIVGEDSPEFAAIRQDVLLDIITPLLDETPNFRKFSDNYKKFAANNSELSKELFPNSVGALKELDQIASAAEKFSPEKAPKLVDFGAVGAVVLFGHGIAKAGLKVRTAKRLWDILVLQKNMSNKRQMMSEMLGYDINAAILSKKMPVIGGGISTITNPQEQQ